MFLEKASKKEKGYLCLKPVRPVAFLICSFRLGMGLCVSPCSLMETGAQLVRIPSAFGSQIYLRPLGPIRGHRNSVL